MSLSALVCLSACSPAFNFRQYRSPDGFVADFPGRVVVVTRPLRLDGVEVPMTMHAVEVDHISFVVGVVPVSPADGARAQRIGAEMVHALAANLNAAASPAAQVAVARASGVPWTADRYEIKGLANGASEQVSAVIVATPEHVYQLLVAGPSGFFDSAAGRDAVDTFVTSLKVD